MKKTFLLPLLSGALLLGAAELLPDPGFLAAKSGAAPAGLKMPASGGQLTVETKDGKNVLKIEVKKNFYLRSLKYITVAEGQKFTLSADVSGKGTVTLTVYCFGKDHRFCGRMAEAFKVNGKQTVKRNSPSRRNSTPRLSAHASSTSPSPPAPGSWPGSASPTTAPRPTPRRCARASPRRWRGTASFSCRGKSWTSAPSRSPRA